MFQIVVKLSLAAALLLHLVLGCCHHDSFAAAARHEPQAGHGHDHYHGCPPAEPCPAPHDDHDCPCTCQWVNNASGPAPPTVAPALDMGTSLLVPFGSQDGSDSSLNFRFCGADDVHPLPLRAHLAFCRLLL